MKRFWKLGIFGIIAFATIAFAADKYISSSGDIILKTAMSKKVNLQDTLYTTQAGKVGIGTANPSYAVDIVNSAASGDMQLRVANTSSSNLGGAAEIYMAHGGSGANPRSITFDRDNDNLIFYKGSTAQMSISSIGVIGMPYQPSFAAWRSSASGNLTSGSTYKLAEGGTLTEQWDNTASLDNSSGSGLFTIPTTGHYMFNTKVTAYCTSGYVSYCALYFNDNGTYRSLDSKYQSAGTSKYARSRDAGLRGSVDGYA